MGRSMVLSFSYEETRSSTSVRRCFETKFQKQPPRERPLPRGINRSRIFCVIHHSPGRFRPSVGQIVVDPASNPKRWSIKVNTYCYLEARKS